jgi:hypothetical protein
MPGYPPAMASPPSVRPWSGSPQLTVARFSRCSAAAYVTEAHAHGDLEAVAEGAGWNWPPSGAGPRAAEGRSPAGPRCAYYRRATALASVGSPSCPTGKGQGLGSRQLRHTEEQVSARDFQRTYL